VLNGRDDLSSMFPAHGAIEFIVNFSIRMAAKLSRVTQETLANWAKRGILVPPLSTGSGRPERVYTFRDLVAIRVLVALRDGGIDPRALRRVVDYVRKRKGLSATEAIASSVLVTDGHDVYEVDEVDGAVSALRMPGQRVLHLVPLAALVVELQRDTRKAMKAA
jgi:DNA-binding transcriptional MerR regulator